MTAVGLLVNCIAYFAFDFYTHTYSYQFLVNFGIGNMLAVFCLNRGWLFQKLANINFSQTLLFYLVSLGILCFGFFYASASFTPFRQAVLATGYSLIIFNLGFAKHKPRYFETAVWQQNLGKKAYGLYCWHAPILTGVEKIAGYFDATLSPYWLFGITLVVVIPVANISYKYFEVHFLKLKERFR